MSDRPRFVLVLRDAAPEPLDDDPALEKASVRKLRALLKHLGREWHLRCVSFAIPDATPIMWGHGEGI